MKLKGYLIVLFVNITVCTCAQTVNSFKQSVGISYSLGPSLYGPLVSGKGGASFSSSVFEQYALVYIHGLSDDLRFQTGMLYATTQASYSPADRSDDTVSYSFDETIHLVSIPLGFRYLVGKHFYYNGGFLLDFDLDRTEHFDNQNGLGVFVGLGLSWNITERIDLYINSDLKFHGILGLNKEYGHSRLKEMGFGFGVNYGF